MPAANDFYDSSGYPSTGGAGSSASMRAELDLIEAGFTKLPTMAANGSKIVRVNAGGTALETVDLAASTGAALVGTIAAGTGAVSRTLQAKAREICSVADFGASTSASAADNTTAFNAALLAHSVVFVPGDISDTYDLNALTALTTSHILYGNAKVRFNTTGDCITLTGSSLQAHHIEIVGLTFGNVTNVPSSFIKNNGFLNSRFEKLKFDGVAATYCIDNWKGYGTTVDKCTFTDVTGSAIRLRDDGAVNTYSYVFKIRDTDITRISVNGITCEGTNVLLIEGGVIESCSGKGIATATAGGTVQGWNITANGTYFESNTGNDIDLGTDGTNYWSTAVLTGCTFVGTPTIALGAKSKVTVIGCNNSGGNVCTISGSSNAEAYLIQSPNFTQSGTFAWHEIGGANPTLPTSYTPSVTNVTTSSASGKYVVNGRLCTVQFRIVVSGAPSGNIQISLPFAAANNQANANVGMLTATDTGTAYYFGQAWLKTSNVIEVHDRGASEWSAAVPHGWANTDEISGTISYFI